MQNREVKPLDNVLDDVKNEIKKRNITPIPAASKKASLIPLGLYKAASIAAILIVSICLWHFVPNRKTEQSSLVSDKKTPLSRNSSQTLPSNFTSKAQTLLAPLTHIAPNHNSKVAASYEPAIHLKSMMENDSAIKQATNEELNRTNISDEEEQEAPRQSLKTKEQIYGNNNVLAYNRHNRRELSVSIATYFGGMGNSSYSSRMPILAVAAPIGAYPGDLSGENIDNLAIEGVDAGKRIKYHQPIKFGISIRKKLNNKWGIQTGITYTHLSSESTSGHDEQNTSEQKLDYIGIPVSVSYTIIKGKHYQIYAIAGAEAEKLVGGKERKNGVPDKKIKESRPQFSINGAIGAEYNITKETGVYIEPGISHYINNGSNIDNIYKAKPNNFSLNIGFRVHLNK